LTSPISDEGEISAGEVKARPAGIHMPSRATAPSDDGDDLVAPERAEFDFRIHCAIGEGCDLAATLRGCYAA
jgi:hypothetical protein